MTTLDSAARVLRLYGSDPQPLTVTGVANRLSAPKSNISRLLRSMEDAGFLDSIPSGRGYRPSVLMLDVARAYRRSSRLLERAIERVASLSREFGHTGYVTLREGGYVTAVSDHPGNGILRVEAPIGRRMPAAHTATGRSLLARLPDTDIRALFADGVPDGPAAAPKTLDQLLSRIAEIREAGYAISLNEAAPGVGGLAAAVGDPESEEEVSLCLVFPLAAMTLDMRQHMATALRDTARAIAEWTGDRACHACRRNGTVSP
jgi:DNA-binding IclR family transcriptional regulator